MASGMWVGIHLRSSKVLGAIQGLRIAKVTCDNELRPMRKGHRSWSRPRISRDSAAPAL